MDDFDIPIFLDEATLIAAVRRLRHESGLSREELLCFRIGCRVSSLLDSGGSPAALAYLHRVLDHPRLARLVFQSPGAPSILATILLQCAVPSRAGARDLLARIRPFATAGRQAEIERAIAFLDRLQAARMAAD